MEGKIRIAITQGDINGVGWEVVLKSFEDPTMLELCTPVIYGSPKVATYHRKTMDIQTSFSIISSATDAADVISNGTEISLDSDGYYSFDATTNAYYFFAAKLSDGTYIKWNSSQYISREPLIIVNEFKTQKKHRIML